MQEGTDVHLLHTGWRDTPERKEVRQRFNKAQTMAPSELQNHVKESLKRKTLNNKPRDSA